MKRNLDETQEKILQRLKGSPRRIRNLDAAVRRIRVTPDADDSTFDKAVVAVLDEHPEISGGKAAGLAAARRRHPEAFQGGDAA